ncbi:hypothetical protein B0T16DRAFT_459954 [Cercophora newfieldiana]|uniref:Uncharacterized protein n=1 Tax=Cercophora newfieldiana TaxID=92897 RepID=A0AA39Y157_9PEZI|nr:hypothetical protein B0T16DRAFT_459954 [Cercophora newfieldiana]
MKRTYFLVPTRDYSPSGAIALGNLIKTPRSPEFPLNDPGSETVRKLVASALTITETDAKRETKTSSSVKPSIWTSFLSGIGPGIDLGLDKTKVDGLSYSIPRLSTRTINPTLADIRAIFAEEQVQDGIRDSRFTTNLYLIVGVQIAHGAEYLSSSLRGNGGGAHLAVDLAATGVPLTAGVGAEATKSREEVVGGKIEDDFVFAYSLREVLYRRKNVVEQRQPSLMGDLMSAFSGRPVTKDVEFEAEFSGLKEDDEDLLQYWDWKTEDVADLDGELCEVVHVDPYD